MLNNFIYAKQKSLFEEALNNGEVLDEAIVFIEDSKEIWNHGTYFSGDKVDLNDIEASILNILDTKGYVTDAEMNAAIASGSITGITINGETKNPTNGIVDIGTVITNHQDISGKQDTLISGTNIKTINGESILGEGNIESGSEQVQSDWNETDTSSSAYIVNKPTMPTKTSELENDSGFLAKDLVGYSVDNIIINEYTRNRTGDIIAWSYADKYIRIYHNSGDSKILDIHASGDGTKFLSDDGTYKEISSNSSSSSGSGAYAEIKHGTSDTTFTLTPNTFHVWDNVTTLDLSFGEETEGIANEFLFQFTSGTTATTLTLPDTIKWANDEVPTIEANKIYQVSILKGLASVLVLSIFPFTLSAGDNGESGVALYEYLYNNYGETTSTITEEIYAAPTGSQISSIEYGTYDNYTGYWMNGGYNSAGLRLNYCLQSSGYVEISTENEEESA